MTIQIIIVITLITVFVIDSVTSLLLDNSNYLGFGIRIVLYVIVILIILAK